MSKFVKVRTELRDLALIKRSLDDLKLAYAENERFTHIWSGYSQQAPLVVKQKGVTFAFRTNEDGAYEAIGDDMQMAQIRSTVQQIQQRYAYHKVLSEVEQAGFALVEERIGKDQVIRMTVRRWS
ncbi:MAG: DUF1257 domain-containing protein [Caldilineaceae bacterium]